MKAYYLKFGLLLTILVFSNSILAQIITEKKGNGLEVYITPVKYIFQINDSALFTIKFINYSDSIIQIPKLPTIEFYDYSLDPSIWSKSRRENIFTDLQRYKGHLFESFCLSFTGEYVYIPPEISGNDSLIAIYEQNIHKKEVRDSLLRLEKININPGDSVSLNIDLFPWKIMIYPGKYRARIHFILAPLCSIESNWAEFIFKKTLAGEYRLD